MSSPLSSHLATLVVALAVALSACGDSTGPVGPEPRPTVTLVRVTPLDVSLEVDASAQLAATPLSTAGQPLLDRAIVWASDDAAIATVSTTGVVTAHRVGTVRVTATSEGVIGSIMIDVDPIAAAGMSIIAPSPTLEEGVRQVLRATVHDVQGRPLADRVISWRSEAPTVASVSATGEVTALRAGEARIVAQHGTLDIGVNITVTATFTADLLFDAYTPGETGARLFLTHAGNGDTSPVLPFVGAWDAVASPDGTRIAFSCASDGAAICTANADGTGIRVLTTDERQNEDQPSWSPDGSRIAFRRWAHGGTVGDANPSDIWVMNADGTAQVNLTNDALVQHTPVWSPVAFDGAIRLAFAQESRSDEGYVLSRIYTMRVNGTARQAASAVAGFSDSDPSWSPDASTLVFSRLGGEYDGELVLVDLATGAERTLFAQPVSDAQRHPAWSPDGRHIAFTSTHETSPNGNYRRQVYSVRADGTGLRRHTVSDVDKAHPAWLPR